MEKKHLIRTLGLTQILMMGIGGTMGAGVFVLTGHAERLTNSITHSARNRRDRHKSGNGRPAPVGRGCVGRDSRRGGL